MHLPAHLIHSILLLTLSAIGTIPPMPSLGVSSPKRDSLWGHLEATPSICPALVPPIQPPLQAHAPKDDFVSFEEWKKIREGESTPEARQDPLLNVSDSNDTSAPNITKTPEVEEVKNPGHRYNYASPDCSARIHSASPQTQHASSLLHKSRDRYMLTPCKASQHWVVIELCDDIRVEAIEISVWEFFSGIVRDIKLSVDEDDATTWKEVGSFVGRNVRGVQTFSLPEATSFHRFIRIDFPSYYGSEYYCPVSQVKVFGMNQMEAFKREQKRSVQSQQEREKERSAADEADVEAQRAFEAAEKARLSKNRKQEEEAREKELGELERLVHRQALQANLFKPSATFESYLSASTPDASITTKPSGPVANATHDTSRPETNSTDSHAKGSIRSDSSESIYASITRRLNALEGNSPLIARYIEEQSRVMRSALATLERDWDNWRLEHDTVERSRWEQERMRQEDRLGKVVSQLELQRTVQELDRNSMTAQLRLLSEELAYERRRGLAQTAIMIVVIILGVASRTSAIDAVLRPIVTEAQRRRCVYKLDRTHGPLTGLRIDMGADRPPAVIGQGLPNPLDESRLKPKGTPRRPSTPAKRRPASAMNPNFRSFGSLDHLGSTPRPRSSLPRPSGHRRLARSAHLHAIDPKRGLQEGMDSTDDITRELSNMWHD